ncbi:MAG: NADH-quinone oxidoreductase subunit A [Candidatus Omnitrophica bacterium]|nr:NADH-quinone oxidoreductase subunit A [Candidatus Omnitrophota bacterium]
MLKSHFGILVMFILAGGVSGLFIYLTQMLGPKKPNASKNQPFECGQQPFSSPLGKHAVRFYLVGMLFVIFDIELIFLFPWAVVYRELGLSAFVSMMVFLGMFELGFAYAWRKGAFQWK